jgi:hypothetical protein
VGILVHLITLARLILFDSSGCVIEDSRRKPYEPPARLNSCAGIYTTRWPKVSVFHTQVLVRPCLTTLFGGL